MASWSGGARSDLCRLPAGYEVADGALRSRMSSLVWQAW